MSQAEILHYDNPRTDVRSHLAGTFARALDVGCDVGTFMRGLKQAGVVQVAEGVELSSAAEQAEQVLDRVYRVDLSHSQEGLPAHAYDLVLCLDVLEHMQDPWAALKRIHTLLGAHGTLVVSLPNVRNFRVVLPLLLRGRWNYARTGLLDITHLRFFTKATALELLEGAGFRVERLISLSRQPYSKVWWLNLVTLGLFSGFLDYQYLIFARPHQDPRSGAAGVGTT